MAPLTLFVLRPPDANVKAPGMIGPEMSFASRVLPTSSNPRKRALSRVRFVPDMVASPVILHDFNNFNRFQLFCNRSLSTNCGAQAHMLRIELYEEPGRNAIVPRFEVYPGYQRSK